VENERPDSNAGPCGNVDECVLEQTTEDEDEADDHPDVDGFDVGDTWQLFVDAYALGRRR